VNRHHDRRIAGKPLWLAASLLLWQAAPAVSFAQTQNTTYQYQYDAVGNRTQITDPLGTITTNSYDALNRLATTTDPAGTTQYGYDGIDQLTSVTDPRNLVTSYTIDGLGNTAQQISPDTGNTSNTYDDDGNLLTRTDAKGQTTSYQYDALNRVTQISYADGNIIQYSYDQGQNALGRLTGITDATGSIAYTYDAGGRLLTEIRTISNVAYPTAYSYNSAGQLASITYPSGRVVSYTYDTMGRISQIDTTKDGVAHTIVSQVHYQPFGGVTSYTNGAGRVVARNYDLDGRINSFTLGNNVELVSYDAASRITAINDAVNTAAANTYGYDALSRLIQYSGVGGNQSFSYDATGNRTSQVIGANSLNYGISPTSNQLQQTTSGSTNVSYTYDSNGSRTVDSQNQYGYDARGRLTSVQTVQGVIHYAINALGQRIEKILPDNTMVVYHYDSSGKLISESNGQGTFQKDYIYLNGMPVAVFQ
jgi:YD repeat-containing protein